MLYFSAFLIAFLVATSTTPLVKKLAIYIGAVDQPDIRKVHSKIMPRLGGLAIVLGTFAGGIFFLPKSSYLPFIFVGAIIIIVIGALDDKYILSAKVKLLGQFVAASCILFSGLKVDVIYFPIHGKIEIGLLGYIIALFWIIGVTNAVNLMDGLDGLAGGLSTIALSSLMVISILNQNWFVTTICIILIASTLGFLIFNFYPAKIFMGDTGALFLGYCISVLSLLTLQDSNSFSSSIIPIIILAIPILDTFFAIIRRIFKKQSLSAPDKNHLHHSLLKLGNSHRKSVLIIYAFGLAFGVSAILISTNILSGTILVLSTLLIGIILTIKIIGLMESVHLTEAMLHPFKRVHKEKESA